jgi:hypothetical protein
MLLFTDEGVRIEVGMYCDYDGDIWEIRWVGCRGGTPLIMLTPAGFQATWEKRWAGRTDVANVRRTRDESPDMMFRRKGGG